MCSCKIQSQSKMGNNFNLRDGLKIRYYSSPSQGQKIDAKPSQGILDPKQLMDHPLFKKHMPILFGGAALTFHYYNVSEQYSNRVMDDLDFFVIDRQAYKDFKEHRKITFENEKDHRIHFYQRMRENFFIKVTICLCKPKWGQKRYEYLFGIRCLALIELKRLKYRYKGMDQQICEDFRRGKSQSKYFIRKKKKAQDVHDIEMINILMKAKIMGKEK